MKKVLLILFFVGTSCLCSFAQYNDDEVTLKTEVLKTATDNKKNFNNTQKYEFSEQQNYKQKQVIFDERNINEKKNSKVNYEKKFKKTTLGTEYDTTFSQNGVSQQRKLYSKYNINDRFSIDSSYNTKTSGQINNQFNGSLSVSPTMKINDKMSIQNVYSRNLGDKSNSQDVRLNFEPFKDGRMNLNMGAGQVQYDNGSPAHSRLNFGTQIRF